MVSRPRMPTLSATCLEGEIALLENGDVYLFFRHPQLLPNADKPMQLYVNGIISRDLLGRDTIAFRKCAIHNSKDCYSRRERWRSSERPTKQHDMSFLFSLLALFHAWNQAKQFVGALPLHLPSQHFTQGSQKSSDSRQEKPNGETTSTLSSPRLSRSDSHRSFASFMFNSRPSTPTPPALDSFSRCPSWILPPIDPSRSVHLTPELLNFLLSSLHRQYRASRSARIRIVVFLLSGRPSRQNLQKLAFLSSKILLDVCRHARATRG